MKDFAHETHEERQKRTAYIKGQPIVTSCPDYQTTLNTQLKDSVHEDLEWLERIKTNWWYSGNMANGYNVSKDKLSDGRPMNPKLYELHQRLLGFGGQETCLPAVEEDIDPILAHGQLWLDRYVCTMKGAPSQCHRNACDFWEINHNKMDVHIATGYALTEDGMWRQHSWLVHVMPKFVRIIETTVRRIAYFGYVMTDEEAWQFINDNW